MRGRRISIFSFMYNFLAGETP